ncbi:MAG: nucleotide sugar dehydrogenase [Candidatus Omnitrophota bacterium]|nr:nucleotide sugar dehydrogenase [Candidatus Omnitrophota bacterium]
MNKVCVAGLWHLGLVSAATLAELGFRVTGFEADTPKIENLRQGKLPLYEPGLEELVSAHLKKSSLQFEDDPVRAVSQAQVVLITFDTPVDDEDRVDLSELDSTITLITPHLDKNAVVIIHSQVPVGTSERWQVEIDTKRPGASIDVVCSPENLRLGCALELYKKPDMIVVGSDSERARKKAATFFAFFDAQKIYVSRRTAEMAKHALNVFFATSISFANQLGNLCDQVGADGMEIARILKADGRIGKRAQVRPGLGFAGATLARDLRALQRLGHEVGEPTPLIDAVLDINQRQTERVVRLIAQYFEGDMRGKVVTVLGLTYKPGTSTLRRSAALEIIQKLQNLGAEVRAHDPKADIGEYSGKVPFEFIRDPYEAVAGAHAILLTTEWPEYRDLDFAKIRERMSGAVILDAKNHLDAKKIREKGFVYLELGRGQLAGEKV